MDLVASLGDDPNGSPKTLIAWLIAFVIFDLSPPYDENWRFFKTMRDAKEHLTRLYLEAVPKIVPAEGF